ncbi:MAG TPA: hypothetical protein PLV66_15050, partial [Thermoanaerobaculales bacterium]|nr:hypothetical protein [Thermoanaerobaculales bacterium]
MTPRVPPLRIRCVNDAPVHDHASWVLYWMTAARRAAANFSLERAADWSRRLGRPLVVLEALRCDYPWASDRLHRFIVDGMRDNRLALSGTAVTYFPYVEDAPGAGRGLLAALAEHAAVVVTDDFPTFFLPRMVAAAGNRLAVRLEAVDANGLLPMAAADREHPTAYAFRRFLQRELLAHLDPFPLEDPCQDLPPAADLPAEITERWPAAALDDLARGPQGLASLPIDHSVTIAGLRGGSAAARSRLRAFIDAGLPGYAELR